MTNSLYGSTSYGSTKWKNAALFSSTLFFDHENKADDVAQITFLNSLILYSLQKTLQKRLCLLVFGKSVLSMSPVPICLVLCHWKVLPGFMLLKLSVKLFGGEKPTWFVTPDLSCGCSFSCVCQVVKAALRSLQPPRDSQYVVYVLCLHKKSLTIRLCSCSVQGTGTVCLACRACPTSAPFLKVLKWWRRVNVLGDFMATGAHSVLHL